MPELEPRKRRPWYAVALVAGFGGVLAAGLLVLKEQAVRPAEAHVATSSIGETDVSQARWRERMEQKLDALAEKVAHIEGRLDKR